MSTSRKFVWGPRELSTRRLLDCYGASLPVIVLVTEGGNATDDDDDIAAGEIYRIFEVSENEEHMLAHSICDGKIVPCIQDGNLETDFSNEKISLDDIPDYLKGPVMISTTIPLRFKVCEGLEGGSGIDYQRLLAMYDEDTLNWGQDDIYANAGTTKHIYEKLQPNYLVPETNDTYSTPKAEGTTPVAVVKPSEKPPAQTTRKKRPPQPAPKPRIKPNGARTNPQPPTHSDTSSTTEISSSASASVAASDSACDYALGSACGSIDRDATIVYDNNTGDGSRDASHPVTNLQSQPRQMKPVSPISPTTSTEDPRNPGKLSLPSSPSADVSPQHFLSLSDVPEDISSLSVSQLADCMAQMKLDTYAPLLADSCVDGALLKSLDDKAEMTAMMVDTFGMKKMEAHQVWMFAQKGWRPRMT